MDAEEAKNSLAEAQRSYDASVRPPLPRWAPPTCGALLGSAVAVIGLGYPNVWWRFGAVAVAGLLALGAYLLLQRIRSRQGVRGMRGPARRTQATLVIAGAAYLISAMRATPEFRWVFVSMGLAVGIIVWVGLSRQVRR
jgi:hypothetical protein